MNPERCEECTEVRKLGFQIDGLGIVLQKQNLRIDGVKQEQDTRDIEHEQMIQNLTTRMDTMSQDFTEFKQEIKQEVRSIKEGMKEDIPKMFDDAISKLLAKMFKYLVIGILFVLFILGVSFTKPLILKGVDNFKSWVEMYEVSK